MLCGTGLLDSRRIRNNHFSAIASDQPALEVRGPFLRETVSIELCVDLARS